MLWNTFESNREFLAQQYKISNWNEKSGLAPVNLETECNKLISEMPNAPKIRIKAKLFEFILHNAQIEVNPYEWFADKINNCAILTDIRNTWKNEIDKTIMKDCLKRNEQAQNAFAYTGDVDFGHTSPDWDALMEMGISGLLERVNRERFEKKLSQEQKDFYASCEIVYAAVQDFIIRLSNEAKRLETQNEKMYVVSKSLLNLAKGAPKTLLEAMQLTFIYYYLQTNIEGDYIRSLGGLDRLYYKFYKSDLENGTLTKEQARELVRYFLCKFYAAEIGSNIPFYLCGTDVNGNDATNELSYMILEEYNKLNILDPKIQIRYHENIPLDFLKIVLKTIREGKNSFVFMNDKVVMNALMNLGESIEDTRNYVVIGCYESAALGKEVPCTCNGRINIPKAIEIVLYRGKDTLTDKKIGLDTGELCKLNSFDEFYSSVKKQLKYFIEQSVDIITRYEKCYMEINPSPLFSGTMCECVKQGKDAYAGGAKYNNSSVNAFGLATAIDSLVAIKKAVYDDKLVTLEEFAEALKNNWEGNEELQFICKNKYPKYGNNDSETDNLMTDLTDFISSQINKKPNGRGGIFRCGMFSIDWHIPFGQHMGATPDGRKAKEALSKNMSAAIAQDKNGITALINSVTKIDYTKIPNGTVLDLMLHPSAAQGEEGLLALLGILKTYMMRGGLALQFNILNPDILKKAQREPEKFSTLQVRLCGWNVYFVNLSNIEQEEFIRQAEHIGGQ